MKITLRGKIWKQISAKEYNRLLTSSETHNKIAFFKDLFYGELTYFKQLEIAALTEKSKPKNTGYGRSYGWEEPSPFTDSGGKGG